MQGTLALSLALVLGLVGVSVAQNPNKNYFTTCDFMSHHTHVVIPLAQTEEDCESPNTRFFLAHGGTFFCPHNYDVVNVAYFNDSAPQKTLCNAYFNAVQTGDSPIFALRPTLEVNGLIYSAFNLPVPWESEYLYHVFDFGDDGDAGPGSGWNSTTLLDQPDDPIQMRDMRNIWFVEYSVVTQKPANLNFLLHTVQSNGAMYQVITHYISSAPSWQQIILVHNASVALKGPSPGPIHLSTSAPDDFANRLISGKYYTLDAILPVEGASTQKIEVTIFTGLEIYAGVNDGYSTYAANCPFAPPYPQARGLCWPSS